MIPVAADKQLNVLLPHMNKALAKVMEQATPEQLDALGKSSDMKSIMTALFDAARTPTRSNTMLLEILKNSPLFKSMGSVAQDVRALNQLMKQTPMPPALERAMAQFVKTFESMDAAILKQQLSNSGIFLESKLAQPVAPMRELQTLLNTLDELVSKSPKAEARVIGQELKQLVSQFEGGTRSSKEITTALQQLLDTFKAPMQKVSVLDRFENLKALERLQKALEAVLVPSQKPSATKVASMLMPLLAQMQTLHVATGQMPLAQANALMQALEQIITALKTPNTTDATLLKQSAALLEQINTMPKPDSLVSLPTHRLLEKLEHFLKMESLDPKLIMNDRIVNDLKANILMLGEEIRDNPKLSGTEMARLVEKVSLQIDYYQLYSYVNNASTLYLPFSWAALEEGTISIKNVKNKKFYCEINLMLQEYGELRLMLALYEKNQVNIHVLSSSDTLKSKMREALGELRRAFIEADLTLRDIRFSNPLQASKNAYESYTKMDSGFEVTI